MGFRMRKSLKLAPGVRLNVSKTGIGMSAGVHGARYAVHSSGRRTTMIGNPIFGVGYVHQTGGGRRRTSSRSASAHAPPQPTPRKPGLFAPSGEKALYRAIKNQDVQAIEQVGDEHAD